ncbi:O-antigen ligase family protein [Rothia sp. P5766]|uniref:O-antigen ligase family protein n=1 Tax=Rothia sp. P5766 TaxID=3402656 RepID=UPI003AD8A62C
MSLPDTQEQKSSAEERLSRFTAALGQEAKILAEGTGSLVMVEVITGAFLVTMGVPFFGFPMGLIFLVVLTFLRISKPSRFDVPNRSLFVAVLLVGLTYVAITSLNVGISTPDDVGRRLARISILIAVLLLIADRRIDFRSLILGLAIGLVGNALAFYAGIAPDNYSGALTGWLNDKNVSGLHYGIIPILMFGLFPKRSHRIITLLVFLPMLWETGSRTSMAGLLIGVLWILFAQKANIVVKFGLGAFVAWLFEWLQTNYADNPIFGDRAGSDQLRARIDEASWEKVSSAPWSGWGMGQATVNIQDHRFFFHNSYWTLLVEGGIIWLALVAGLTLLAVFMWKQHGIVKGQRVLTAEAATVFLAICSWRLGEVMLTLPWVFAVGLALSLTARPKKQGAEKNFVVT